MWTHWWTCHHLYCFDRMAQSQDIAEVIRDRDAHIRAQHPYWRPTAAELYISSWHQTPTDA